VRGRQPPAPPGGEFKDVSPLTDKTVGERTLEALSPLPPASFCGILLPHTSSTLHPKRPDETYPLQAPAGVAFLLFTLPSYAAGKGVALTGLNRVALVVGNSTLI